VKTPNPETVPTLREDPFWAWQPGEFVSTVLKPSLEDIAEATGVPRSLLSEPNPLNPYRRDPKLIVRPAPKEEPPLPPLGIGPVRVVEHLLSFPPGTKPNLNGDLFPRTAFTMGYNVPVDHRDFRQEYQVEPPKPPTEEERRVWGGEPGDPRRNRDARFRDVASESIIGDRIKNPCGEVALGPPQPVTMLHMPKKRSVLIDDPEPKPKPELKDWDGWPLGDPNDE
jgi:hypothetical protein